MSFLKAVLCVLTLSLAVSAQARKVQTLKCLSADQTPVEIVFNRGVDPLVPFTSYEFGAQLEVFSKRGIYSRTDVRITPLKTTHDMDLRGDAGGAVYLRLSPIVNQNVFSGKYQGHLFVNDLDAKAYFNFKGTDSQPGLTCEAH